MKEIYRKINCVIYGYREKYEFTDFRNPLPNSIILDANILINSINPVVPSIQKTKNLYLASRTFFNRLYKDRNCIGFVPMSVVLECFQFIMRAEIEKFVFIYNQNNLSIRPLPPRAVDALKVKPSIMQQSGAAQKINDFLKTLTKSRIVTIEPGLLPIITNNPFSQDIANVMNQLNLTPNDANILVVAKRYGVNQIASVDKDMLKIQQLGFDIYTSRHCR